MEKKLKKVYICVCTYLDSVMYVCVCVYIYISVDSDTDIGITESLCCTSETNTIL